MRKDEFEYMETVNPGTQGGNDQEGLDLFSEDFDVDHYYNKAVSGTVETADDDLPGEEEFEKILREAMDTDSELIGMVEEMDNEEAFSLNLILVPEELALDREYSGPVYGFYRQETGYHVIFGWEGHMVPEEIGAECIGYIEPVDAEESGWKVEWEISDHYRYYTQQETDGEAAACLHRFRINGNFCVIGKRTQEGIVFYKGEKYGATDTFHEVKELETEVYTMTKKLFSRSAGLIETNWLNEVCAVISGCGSVGSLVALQLARSGVGRFVLIDEDCVEIHNVCRHQCGLRDIGRRKVDAVRERILCINPDAEVICFRKKFQEVPWPYGKEEWLRPEKAIFIGTCDNRVGNAFVCDAAYEAGIPFAALGFNARAWGGEIFTCLPEKNEVCYRCTFKKQIEESIEQERSSHDYMDAADEGKVKFEPGLDVDIEFGVSLFDKIILDIINRHNEEYLPRIYHRLTQYTFFSGTDQKPEEFWRKLMKEPVSIKRAGLPDSLRRCGFCIRK